MEIPFVSEDFQRAFRNQFPAQTSTGRDLHVSDTVIPIVDFTPTASGASLPESLRFSINRNSANLKRVSTGTITLSNKTGFFRILGTNVSQNTSTQILTFQFEEIATSTQDTVYEWLATPNGNSCDFNIFIPAGYKFICFVDTNTTVSFVRTQLADVNGNLQSPSGYSPQ